MNSFSQFSPNSKVWIYGADRLLTQDEVNIINNKLTAFALGWKAHEMPLTADAGVLHNCFLVFMVDEAGHGASGCSIDKSVHLVKALGEEFNLNFFNRMLVYVLDGSNVEIYDTNGLKQAINDGKLDKNSLVANSLVQTKQAFEENFWIKLEKSWAARYLVATV